MFISSDVPHRLHKCGPCLSWLRKHALPFGRDLVEPPAPLARLFDPSALDPSTLLEAIDQGVEGIDVEGQLAARPTCGAACSARSRAGAARRGSERMSNSADPRFSSRSSARVLMPAMNR
jgi:hypothetical protein